MASSHFSPTVAPQVGQRTVSTCFGVRSFFTMGPGRWGAPRDPESARCFSSLSVVARMIESGGGFSFEQTPRKTARLAESGQSEKIVSVV